jgi:hypothetical protein
VRHPLRAFNSALAPVVPVYVLTMVIVVTATGVEIEIFDAAGMRSSLFDQIEIVAVIGMVDVISITKIAIERGKRSAWRAVFYTLFAGVFKNHYRGKSANMQSFECAVTQGGSSD